jgi:NAD(P)-dependent dehydrogenase (short-subunit alcohol dehydrogenase family)
MLTACQGLAPEQWECAMGRIDNKVALVVGASQAGNMGQAIARRFVNEGARVVVSGRDVDGLKKFSAEAGAVSMPCNIRSRSDVFRLMDDIVAAHGRLDIAVNTATARRYGPFENVTEDDIDDMLGTIFKGSFFFMQAAVAAMKKSGGGAIVNVTSTGATTVTAGRSTHQAAKAGLEHLARSVALEVGQFGIRVNNVAPGLTIVPNRMNEVFIRGYSNATIQETPLGRVSTVEDVASAVLFAASDECYMTGQTFHPTGGITLCRFPTNTEIAESLEEAKAYFGVAKS